MPGFISHYLFGIKTYHSLQECNLKNIIKHHPSSFQLGLQGPDIYFFYLPSLIGEGSKNIGSLMHDSKVHAFFKRFTREMELIKEDTPTASAAASFGKYHLETAISYFAGFLCHYIFDCCCHPYIYAVTDYRADDPERLCYYARHRTFETHLDTLLLKHLKHTAPSQFRRSSVIPNNRFETGCLALLLCRCINDVFYPDNSHPIYKKADMTRSKRYIDRLYYRDTKRNRVSPKTIRNVIFSIKLECRILDDPTGLKKQMVEKLENRTVKYNLISSLMSAPVPQNDFLNLAHKTWYSPWEHHKKRQESFPDLFSRAKSECTNILLLLEQYTTSLTDTLPNTPLSKRYLLEALGSRSYHSGLPLTEFK